MADRHLRLPENDGGMTAAAVDMQAPGSRANGPGDGQRSLERGSVDMTQATTQTKQPVKTAATAHGSVGEGLAAGFRMRCTSGALR